MIELRRRAREQSDRRVIAAFAPGSLREAIHFVQRHTKKEEAGEEERGLPHKASELNHNLICLWYKWALTYYLIMGFSAKPPSTAALQSTCLRGSADPTLGPPRDRGSCDLSGSLELMISQMGRRRRGRRERLQWEAVSTLHCPLATLANEPWWADLPYEGPGLRFS